MQEPKLEGDSGGGESSTMSRKLDIEQKHIFNGNRFMTNTGEDTGVFHRDVDKLMHQYTNLRLSIYGQYKGYLPDYTSQQELKSYIDEQFVRLVKEFDINGPVDFPGYVKTKLTYRVRHSYIKGEYRDRQRVFVTRNDFDVTNLMERNPSNDEELDYYEALEYALSGVSLDEVERGILYLLLQEQTNTQIDKEIRKKYPEHKLSAVAVREKTKTMQDFLRSRLHESMEY